MDEAGSSGRDDSAVEDAALHEDAVADEGATESSATSGDGGTSTSIVATVAAPPNGGDPYLGPLTFDWGTNCTIPVVETVLKSGSSVTLSYRIDVVGEGSNRVVSFVDMSALDVNGTPVPSGQLEAVLAGFRLPSFVVDAEATVVEMRGVQELVDQIQATMYPDEERDTRGLAALMEDVVAAKYWDTWAGFWAGFGTIDEPRFETVVSTPIANSFFDTRLVVESLGTTSDGLAILRSTQTVDGENLLHAIGVANDATGRDLSDSPQPTSGQRVTTVDVTTDPLTLRPATAQIDISTQIDYAGDVQSNHERRAWTFDWTSSDCTP